MPRPDINRIRDELDEELGMQDLSTSTKPEKTWGMLWEEHNNTIAAIAIVLLLAFLVAMLLTSHRHEYEQGELRIYWSDGKVGLIETCECGYERGVIYDKYRYETCTVEWMKGQDFWIQHRKKTSQKDQPKTE